MEKKNCIRCGQEINPLRLKALPTATTCVPCSTTNKKRGVPFMYGKKEDTWVDVVLMEEETYKKYENNKNK